MRANGEAFWRSVKARIWKRASRSPLWSARCLVFPLLMLGWHHDAEEAGPATGVRCRPGSLARRVTPASDGGINVRTSTALPNRRLHRHYIQRKRYPAAVCLLPGPVADPVLQAMAAEMALSETAFLLRVDNEPWETGTTFSIALVHAPDRGAALRAYDPRLEDLLRTAVGLGDLNLREDASRSFIDVGDPRDHRAHPPQRPSPTSTRRWRPSVSSTPKPLVDEE